MVQQIADKDVTSDDEGEEDGEVEVVGLAKKCLELLDGEGKGLVEG